MPDAAPHSPDDTLDQWLVLRAQQGEEEAMRKLVVRWGPRLRRYAMRLTNNPEGAADASQEAWLAIVRGLRRLNDPACFRRWAYQIVARKCVDWIRKQQQTRDVTSPLTEEPAAPIDACDSVDRRESVRRALKRLPNRDQILLAMHYADSLPLAEIAATVGLPLGTVKSRLHHARKRLKKALQQGEPIAPKGRLTP